MYLGYIQPTYRGIFENNNLLSVPEEQHGLLESVLVCAPGTKTLFLCVHCPFNICQKKSVHPPSASLLL